MNFNMFISAMATKGACAFLVKCANIIWLIIAVMGEFTVISFEARSMQEEFARDPPRHARRAGIELHRRRVRGHQGDARSSPVSAAAGAARRTPRVWSVQREAPPRSVPFVVLAPPQVSFVVGTEAGNRLLLKTGGARNDGSAPGDVAGRVGGASGRSGNSAAGRGRGAWSYVPA